MVVFADAEAGTRPAVVKMLRCVGTLAPVGAADTVCAAFALHGWWMEGVQRAD